MSVLKMANLASNLLLLIFLSLVCSLSNADSLQKRVLEAPLELDNGWEYQGCYVYSALPTSGEASRTDW